jgi:hypothetical protein
VKSNERVLCVGHSSQLIMYLCQTDIAEALLGAVV